MRITNKLGLPQPFVDAATSEYAYKPKRYSVTAVLKGTREAILQRRHDDEIEQDASDMVWAIFGTAVHSILENAQETASQIKENKLVVEMPNGYELSGIFDLYDDATKTVTDYKTASVWKVQFGDFSDWRRQVLAYCWMLRRIGFDASRGEVVALLKDHSKAQAAIGKHPEHPVKRISWEFGPRDFDEIGQYLVGKFAQIEACEQLPDDQLPLCSDAERWSRGEAYAVMKKGVQKARKLFKAEEYGEAAEYKAREFAAVNGGGLYVEHRPGEDAKCIGYCSAAPFCGYWRERYGEGE